MSFDQLKQHLLESRFWRTDRPVELIETHISCVYLVGDRAFKQKKPVDLGFVDFTTLEKRKHYCEEELRLNSRLAPELYLGIRTITGSEESPELEVKGEPIDYLVEMKRFDQSDLMTVAEEEGRLTEGHMDQLAKLIAEFHDACPAAGEDSLFGSVEKVNDPVEGNFEKLICAEMDEELKQRLSRLRDWTKTEHRRLSRWFEQRKANGHIRECHGDMHLGNMILQGETITVFDCIEFNDAFRWIDTISEVAFCAMDITERGHPELAHLLLNAYLEQTGDYESLPGLRYYLCYRAMVRAKVAWLRLQQHPSGAEEELWKELETYVVLAEQYANRYRTGVIVMRGVSGTGKSFGGEQLVRELGAIRVRSDVERKRIASAEGITELYGSEMTERTYKRLRHAAEQGIEGGCLMLLDATFLEADQVRQVVGWASESGVRCAVLELTAPDEVLKERVSQRETEGLDPSDADLRVLEKQLSRWEPLPDEFPVPVIRLSTEQDGCWDEAIRELRKAIPEVTRQ